RTSWWVDLLFGSRSKNTRRRQKSSRHQQTARRRAGFELLEPRQMMAVITVGLAGQTHTENMPQVDDMDAWTYKGEWESTLSEIVEIELQTDDIYVTTLDQNLQIKYTFTVNDDADGGGPRTDFYSDILTDIRHERPRTGTIVIPAGTSLSPSG